MSLPPLVLHPPFNITRISHVVLTSRDLDASCRFYCDVLGLVLTARDEDAAYLRGLEEACHHSLVLRKSADAPVCQAIGFRVLTDADLDIAQDYFARRNVQNRWQDAPYQGRTLRLVDGSGSPIELCSTMGTQMRLMQRFDKFHGGSPQRLDHVQVAAADIQTACDFYAALGFRLTEYTAKDGTDELWGVWLQRKGNPHDIVFSNGLGPRLHHFAYTVPATHARRNVAGVNKIAHFKGTDFAVGRLSPQVGNRKAAQESANEGRPGSQTFKGASFALTLVENRIFAPEYFDFLLTRSGLARHRIERPGFCFGPYHSDRDRACC